MILQQFDADIGIIKTPAHIAKLWDAIAAGYSQFLERLLKPVDDGLGGLASLGRVVRKTSASQRDPAALMAHFHKALERFDKSAPNYAAFFDPDTFEEFQFSKGSFKPELGRKCPIMRHTLNSRSRELLEWRRRYNETPSTELLDVFGNVLSFAREFIDDTDSAKFSDVDELTAINFDTIEDDEECRINGVIGMGIKSDMLHHLDSALFPARDRRSLLGFYLLSDGSNFGLPSKSSEFVMYDPERTFKNGSIYASHSFWYPYALFTLHSLRLYRLLKRDLVPLGVALDDHYRFVYTASFLKQVCVLEQAKIESFLARVSGELVQSGTIGVVLVLGAPSERALPLCAPRVRRPRRASGSGCFSRGFPRARQGLQVGPGRAREGVGRAR